MINDILIIIIIFLLCIYLYNNKTHENFLPFDPNFNYESCKNLIKERKKVDMLSETYCNKNNQLQNNRTNINLSETCYNNITRKVVLDKETDNWCSKVSQDNLNKINDEISKELNLDINNVEGSQFIQEQNFLINNIVPINNDEKYALIDNIENISNVPSSINKTYTDLDYKELESKYSQYNNNL